MIKKWPVISEPEHRDAGANPPRILWIDWSGVHRPHSALMFFLATPIVVIVGAGCLFLSAALNSESVSKGQLAFCVTFASIWAITTLSIFAVVRSRWRFERDRALQAIRSRAEMTDADRSEAILKLHWKAADGFWRPKPKPAFIKRLLRMSGAGVVLVDERLRDDVASIPIATDFLEPAPLLNRPNKLSGIAAFGLIGAALVGVILIANTIESRRLDLGNLLIIGSYWWAIVIAARRFGWRLGEDSAPLAGMGVVSDQKRRRWTAHDSWLFIRKSRRGPVVEFISDAACFALLFDSVDNEGFAELWRRWNHPNPRPDLL